MFNRKVKTPLPEMVSTEVARDVGKPGLVIELSQDVKDALARLEEAIGQQRRIDEALCRAARRIGSLRIGTRSSDGKAFRQ